jgi:hypothetical protein
MLRRAAGVAALLLLFTVPAHAGTLGLAEVRGTDGTLIGKAGGGAYAYPADGSVLRIGSSRATAARVELRNVSMFNGRVTVKRLVVPARGLAGARVDGLVVDGTGYVVGPNALISLGGGSYIVALQEAVSPGRTGSGLVALRAFVSDPSLGLAPGTQLLVGLARAAHPAAAAGSAAVVLGLPQLAAAQASLAGVPTFLPPELPDVPTNTLGGQAVALAYQFLGVPYTWGGATPFGFDCSGLTMYVYAQLGIQLPHYAADQWQMLPHVDASQLEPGDLVFFEPRSNGPGHVGIFAGGDNFIEAPHTGDVVKIASLSQEAAETGYVGAARPSALAGSFFGY